MPLALRTVAVTLNPPDGLGAIYVLLTSTVPLLASCEKLVLSPQLKVRLEPAGKFDSIAVNVSACPTAAFAGPVNVKAGVTGAFNIVSMLDAVNR